METAAPPEPGLLGRVLLYDDDFHCVPGIARLFHHAGFEAVGCSSLDRAEALAREGGFDAVFLDIMTPAGPLGHTLIARLRADPRTAELPILAISAYGGDLLGTALRLGADAAIERYDLNGRVVPLLARLCREGRAGARILVVEDDEAVAELVEQTLQCAPTRYAVRACASVRQAAKQLAAWQPHLVLLDLQLPDGDGLAFLSELRSLRAAGDLGVIVLSAAPRADLGPLSLRQGADDFISKPPAGDELLARVEALLRRLHPQAAAARSLAAGPLRLDLAQRLLTCSGAPGPALTPSEFRLLRLLFERHPGAATWAEAERVARGVEADGGGEASVALRSLVAALRAKLAPDAAACLATRRGVGLALDVSDLGG